MNIEDCLKKEEVDIALIKNVYELDWSGVIFPTDSYDLSVRHSEKSLVDRTVHEIKEAEGEFKRKLTKAKQIYINNINYVKKMDERLPALESDPENSNDNKTGPICPLCLKVEHRLKRHIQGMHKDIATDEALEFALACSKLMYDNSKRSKVTIESTSGFNTKKKPVNFAKRKANYKECPLCKTLQLNLSCHLSNVHGLKGEKHQSERDRLCRAPPTIPICFTKLENNVRIMKTEEEIEEAKDTYSEVIETQNEELSKLKAMSKEVEDLKVKMIEADNIETYHKLKLELELAQEKYKILRYSDKREMSPILKLWRDSFVKSLSDSKMDNPARAGNMAADVFLPYEKSSENQLEWKTLLNGLEIKIILQCFLDSSKLTKESKIKYMRMALQMANFIIFDIESPEAINREDGTIHSKFEGTKLEFEKKIKVAAKQQANENISRREAAAKKVLNEDELIEIKTEIENFMKETVKELPKDYEIKEIYQIRDNLICEGTILMGRRSKEICNMLKSEVELAQEIDVDGKKMHVVLVKEHKRKCTGKPAGVVFSESGFLVLKYYIQHLLSTICHDQFNPYVFPRKKSLGNVGEPLTLQEHNCILKTKGINGKAVSSRTVRGSYITRDRMSNSSLEQRQTLADGMSHSLPVADMHYAYTSVVESVAKSQRAMATSTPAKMTAELTESSSIDAGASPARHDVMNCSPDIHKVKRKLGNEGKDPKMVPFTSTPVKKTAELTESSSIDAGASPARHVINYSPDIHKVKRKIETVHEGKDPKKAKADESMNSGDSMESADSSLNCTTLKLRYRTVKVKKMSKQ